MTTQTFTTGPDTYTVTDSGTYTLDFLAGDDNLTINGPDNLSTIVNATMGDGNDYVRVAVGTATIDGGSGDDWFDVSAPNATLSGGTGQDTYVIRKASDVVIENAGEGTDRVFANFTYTLTANVENLYLSGSGAINGTGNSLNNIVSGNDADNMLYGLGGNDKILGNGGNDTLDGGTGHDRMLGGIGDDTYYVDDYSDHAIENGGEGTDQVFSTANYRLGANVENMTLIGSASIWGYGNDLDNVLTGNGAANKLFGMGGNDIINGGAGNDKVWGGTGDDIFYVDSYNDRVIEYAGEGTDTVFSSSNYKLADNIENLTLSGTDSIWGYGNGGNNELTGNDGNNKLFGLDGNDILHGGGGNDLLNGGIGIDLMDGGTGNDTYYVDNIGDVVTENANEGTDTVHTTVTYSLTDNVENGYIDGSLGVGLYGNALDNTLVGNAGDDTINGNDGNDTIHGGGGMDFLYAGNGDDTVYGDTGNDTLFGESGSDHLYGGDGTDTLYGGADNDVLDGGIGHDVLIGGAGQDTLTGGADSDTFLFQATTDSQVGAYDTVTDFQSNLGTVAGDDVLDFSGIDANASVSGDQAFTWNNDTAAANSLWYSAMTHNGDGSADMLINGDTNGDGVADFQVMVHLTTGNLFTDDIIF
jgi:Ca2+-binding RTX toxin-like protein